MAESPLWCATVLTMTFQLSVFHSAFLWSVSVIAICHQVSEFKEHKLPLGLISPNMVNSNPVTLHMYATLYGWISGSPVLSSQPMLCVLGQWIQWENPFLLAPESRTSSWNRCQLIGAKLFCSCPKHSWTIIISPSEIFWSVSDCSGFPPSSILSLSSLHIPCAMRMGCNPLNSNDVGFVCHLLWQCQQHANWECDLSNLGV